MTDSEQIAELTASRDELAAKLAEKEVQILADGDMILDLVARMTVIKGGDIPATIEAATAALSVRCHNAEAALKAAREDAERYRWLRSSENLIDGAMNIHSKKNGYMIAVEKLDAAIDAARARQGSEHG